MRMTSRMVKTAALASLTFMTLACNGDNGPTASPSATAGVATRSPSATGGTGSLVSGWRTLAPMPTPRSESNGR